MDYFGSSRESTQRGAPCGCSAPRANIEDVSDDDIAIVEIEDSIDLHGFQPRDIARRLGRHRGVAPRLAQQGACGEGAGGAGRAAAGV